MSQEGLWLQESTTNHHFSWYGTNPMIVVHNDIPTTTIDARTQAHTKLGHSNGQTARLRLIG